MAALSRGEAVCRDDFSTAATEFDGGRGSTPGSVGRGYAPDAPARPRADGARIKSRRGRSPDRSEEHTSELQSLMRISYAVFCLKKKNTTLLHCTTHHTKNNHPRDRETNT